ncbi:MAG: SDR family oxidoreductase [Pseudomonadota bacterium]
MYLLVLGANSYIAQAIARKFADAERANLYLASRKLSLLQKKARDIEIRYPVKAVPLFFDAVDYGSHIEFYNRLDPKPEGVVLAFGYLGDQDLAQRSFHEAKRIVEANFIGAVSILEVVAADFEKRGHGFFIGISSAAGDRGRQSNYIYGSAKSALNTYLSGLRNRLHAKNIHVMTVLPGFVRTKMTDNLKLPGLLTAEPEAVAEDVYKGYQKGRDIVYTKWFWRWIMFIIRAIPEKVFKRTNI